MGTHNYSFSTCVYRGRNEREFELEVTYSVTPGRPAQGPTYSCGGQPAEDAEIEIISVTHNGAPFETSREEDGRLYDEAWDDSARALEDEAADRADYLYDQARDERMMAEWERAA